MTPLLETITQSLNYADLPEPWCVPEIGRFSVEKTLYDYRENAMAFAHDTMYAAMTTEEEKQHFVSLVKPYLWWGE